MATKLAKQTLPAGHSVSDFKGLGPVVSRDTEWGDACLCDLGCFKQEDVDSNKYYHLAVVQSTINNKFYAYFEWGRTRPDGRPNKPSFQFHECSSKQDAQDCCEKQFKSKNTSRGQWQKVGSKDRFVAKPGKDLYVVRLSATRLVGLPCCENLANEDAKGANAAPAAAPTSKKKTTKKKSNLDPQTRKLFTDLIGGAVSYTNAVMSGGKSGKVTLPAQAALDEGRDVLDDAMARIKIVGNEVAAQVSDTELKQLTYHLYGIIPKAKPQGIAEADWILSQDNISTWRLDIDAFETALQAVDMNIEEDETDVMAGIPAKVAYLDPKSEKGKWLEDWWINSTRNKHGHVGKLKVHNMWEIERDGDSKIMRAAQEATLGEMPKKWNNERPLHQMWRERPDLTAQERKLYYDTNTALMFHGTRSVNVPGIVRENLRFPNQLTGVIITGAMFGPGSYFADDWKKSAGYCSSCNPGRRSYYGGGGEVVGRHAFMFAFDVICGNPHVAKDAHGFTSPPNPHHCVFGKAGHTASWGVYGGLQNNEWIIYKRGRIEMKYLAEISF